MKTITKVGLGILAAAGTWIATTSPFTVEQGDQVVVTRFGEPVKVIVNQITNTAEAKIRLEKRYADKGIDFEEGAGLYFKLPWPIEKANDITRKVIVWNGSPQQVNTLDKKFVFIDNSAFYSIADPVQYMQVLQGNREVTASALDTQIDSAVITKISSNDLEEAVRTTVGKKMTVPEELKESGNSEEASSGHEFADIKKGRAVLEAEIHQDAAEACRSKYGLELNAVLITSVSYDPTVKAAVEQRMIQERTRVANKYRSEGEGYLQEMQGKVERKKAEIASEASKKVKDIKGEAEGLVKVILAEGYDKKDEKGNTVHVSGYNQAQDYFNLSRSLEVMEKLGTAKTQFVLNKDDPLLKYLKLE